ncbi:MAG: ribose-phosphate pyrophosphokinase [Candidatus Scalindua sp. AMX11]|nr:MAG: ribose-phosphate pyrophosphokinase [Candidatus Scalindua sp.]NOG85269.1 ribose-phosphate pyrophosphokinase [Planctomycetota bacterium]RZV81512.1 MAG: ribose-phosphate pyrophosphokinase [Candidatus Scalindua sp. SCAELEC01]TDE65415.1 MAG: ribose-phosphate pyrophosphokinase [Candidatus Scalindua sp. AMX11]GJQ59337.1 MAG: ribose-phosphate pyrophosphokinase [Candidatus Scalindua sp.]
MDQKSCIETLNNIKIFTGNANPDLAERVCDYLSIPLGRAEVGKFPDGEIDVKVDEDVRGADVFIVQPTSPPVNENLAELLIMMDCFKRASSARITAVLPYYGYARKDRKDEGRVPITAKLVANIITKAGADRLLTIDLHAAQIQGFFDIPVDHIFAFPVLSEYFKSLGLEDLMVVSPDVGGIKIARSYSRKLDIRMAIVDKRRIGPTEIEVGFVIGDVKGKNVIIMDDLIATAGSICEAAKVLKEKGVKDIYVGATHAVLCGPAVERLSNSPIKELVITDTIPLTEQTRTLGSKLKVLSVAGLVGEAIKRIHTNSSISSMFKEC